MPLLPNECPNCGHLFPRSEYPQVNFAGDPGPIQRDLETAERSLDALQRGVLELYEACPNTITDGSRVKRLLRSLLPWEMTQ